MGFEATRIDLALPAGKYVIAVSGGVDSVVLLDMIAQQVRHVATGTYEIIVAHFDHGIRSDSADDALFVLELAKKYGYAFESRREALGPKASEETARTRRYAFLRAVTANHAARLVTAHHADDCVETIAINMVRGTGWRGLAVLDSDVVRPLLDLSKSEIIAYAQQYHLSWHEDSTNASDAYLRNRIRRKTATLTEDDKRQLLGLRAQQVAVKRQIDTEVSALIKVGEAYSRYFFTHLDSLTALECIRYVTQARLTRPQLIQAQLAIKTARPKSIYQAGDGVQFCFTSRNFVVELIK